MEHVMDGRRIYIGHRGTCGRVCGSGALLVFMLAAAIATGSGIPTLTELVLSGHFQQRDAEIKRTYGRKWTSSTSLDEADPEVAWSCEEKKAYMRQMLDISEYVLPDPGSGLLTWTGFLEDPVGTEVLVAALYDECEALHPKALDYLATKVRDADLPRVKSVVVEYCERHPGKCPPRLVGKLGTPRLLADLPPAAIPKEVLARLGDATAAEDLAAEFTREQDAARACELARALGYVGGVASGKTLAEALDRTEMFFTSTGGQRSVRLCVIEGLGQIHQNHPLLTIDVQREIRRESRRGFGLGGPDEIRTYVQAVYAWAIATYGVELPEVERSPVLTKPRPVGFLSSGR